MSSDALALIVLLRRLAAVDRYARERVARLLYIRESQAAALLLIAHGRAITVDELGAELELSPGGTQAFAQSLVRAGLVRTEPGRALRLSPGAARELGAALGSLTDRLEPVTDVAAAHLAAIVKALEIVRAGDA